MSTLMKVARIYATRLSGEKYLALHCPCGRKPAVNAPELFAEIVICGCGQSYLNNGTVIA